MSKMDERDLIGVTRALQQHAKANSEEEFAEFFLFYDFNRTIKDMHLFMNSSLSWTEDSADRRCCPSPCGAIRGICFCQGNRTISLACTSHYLRRPWQWRRRLAGGSDWHICYVLSERGGPFEQASRAEPKKPD